MRAEQILDTLERFFVIKRPVCLEGPPGGGKTSLVQQAAARLGVEYIHKHMPTMLVEDFGIPTFTPGAESFNYQMPPWWPVDSDAQAILCFDDRNQCGADLQKVLANIQTWGSTPV
jgi:MoxR-like ATPase